MVLFMAGGEIKRFLKKPIFVLSWWFYGKNTKLVREICINWKSIK